MARLFKPTIVRYTDSEGRRCKKGDPGARKKRVKSKTWRGEFRDADGILGSVKLCTNKPASAQMLAELVRRAEREQAGLVDPFEQHRKRPLAEHLADFERHLKAKENSEKHVKNTVSYVGRILESCEFKRISDFSENRVTDYLHERRQGGMSIASSNHYMTAIKSFARWLVRSKRAPENPFDHLSRMNADTDRRHIRRPAADDDFAKLLTATMQGEPFRGISGRDRIILYLVATSTGFRCSELGSLTPASFDLDSHPPTISVKAAYSKRRREDTRPIRKDLAEMLRGWIQERQNAEDDENHVLSMKPGLETVLWPGTWTEKVSEDANVIRAIGRIGDNQVDRFRRDVRLPKVAGDDAAIVLQLGNGRLAGFQIVPFFPLFGDNPVDCPGTHLQVGCNLADGFPGLDTLKDSRPCDR